MAEATIVRAEIHPAIGIARVGNSIDKFFYAPGNTHPSHLDHVALKDQPAMLTEAALTFCFGDAFHPGCELTWAILQRFSYRDFRRLRFNERSTDLPEPDFGDTLTPTIAVAYNGPLRAFGPGDLTKWMAVPWQTDTASCRSGYSGNRWTDKLPSFWPARVPNHVLSEKDYETVMDRSRPSVDRQSAFRNRGDWFLTIGRRYPEQLRRMIKEFGSLGIIESRPGPGDPDFPAEILVESLPGQVFSEGVATMASSIPGPMAESIDAEPDVIPKAARYLRNR